MLDFMFAMIAVGANAVATPGDGSDVTENALPQVGVTETAEAEPVLPQIEDAPTAPAAPAAPQVPQTPTVNIGENVTVGEGVIIGGAAQATQPSPTLPTLPVTPAVPQIDESVIPAGLVPDPQTPSGKFTTAAEVKPIMEATKGNWVAVREYDGSDWLYVTHIWSWRCGLKAMAISINDEPMQNWPLPPCHEEFTTPNAILEDDGIPALQLKLGGVQKVTIQVVYDDLSRDVAVFERGNVLIP